MPTKTIIPVRKSDGTAPDDFPKEGGRRTMGKDGAAVNPGTRFVPLRAPPGRMGLLFQFLQERPSVPPVVVVAEVEAGCPFGSEVRTGDRLLSIAGLAVTMPAHLSFRVGHERDLVFSRPEAIEPGSGAKSERKEKGPGASFGGAPAAAASASEEDETSSKRVQIEKWVRLRFAPPRKRSERRPPPSGDATKKNKCDGEGRAEKMVKMSAEDRKELKQMKKSAYMRMSAGERAELSRIKTERMRSKLARMSPEEREEFKRKKRDYHRRYRAEKMSAKERAKINRGLKEYDKKMFARMSAEEWEEFKRKKHEYYRRYQERMYRAKHQLREKKRKRLAEKQREHGAVASHKRM